jgi:PAS domain S-box-containing protein
MVQDLGRTAVAVRPEPGAVVASVPDAVIATTPLGEITSCDPVAARLYGYVAEELVGQSRDVLIPPERRALERDILAQVMAGAEVRPFHTDRVRRDGTVVTVSLTISPLIDTAGTIVGALTVSHRVSGQHGGADRSEPTVDQQRTDSQEAQDRFQVGMDAERARERVQVQDAEDRFQVGMDAERAKERVQVEGAEDRFRTRMDAERASGRVRVNDVGERARVQREEDRFQVRMDAERAKERVQVQDADDQFQVDMSAERAKERRQVEDAEDRFNVGIDAERARVHSDQEQLQGQLEQSQRLEVLGQLAGGVAHDFNNLLAVILNYATFVTDELVSQPGDRLNAVIGDVEQIRRAAERAAALTHQLLAFARREVIQPRVLDLNAIVTDVEQLLRRTLGAEVVLRTTLAAQPWPVLVDAGQMEQVLVNLAVNARDAMNGGGVLTIDTANIVVDADFITAGSTLQAGRHVRLRVGDTGSGMPADVIDHAFEPFYTTKPDGTGTGLGLATVYGIVTQTAGTIDIYSQPGVGTTFTIMIPATDEPAVPVTAPVPHERTPTGETVLIVEDEEALRAVTQRIFTQNGYQVIAAADGEEALALAAGYDREIHLLVTDVVMPNMLGNEVAEKLRQLKPGIAVLYMSGYAQPILASQGRLDPDAQLIDKPFSAAALIEKAGQVLNGRFHGYRTVETGSAP